MMLAVQSFFMYVECLWFLFFICFINVAWYMVHSNLPATVNQPGWNRINLNFMQ